MCAQKVKLAESPENLIRRKVGRVYWRLGTRVYNRFCQITMPRFEPQIVNRDLGPSIWRSGISANFWQFVKSFYLHLEFVMQFFVKSSQFESISGNQFISLLANHSDYIVLPLKDGPKVLQPLHKFLDRSDRLNRDFGLVKIENRDLKFWP